MDFMGSWSGRRRTSIRGRPSSASAEATGESGWPGCWRGFLRGRGLTALALAYVMEEGLPKEFLRVPIDFLEAAAKRLHDMGYEKVGLWGISKGAELALTVGSLLPGLGQRGGGGGADEHRVPGLCQGQGRLVPAGEQLELSRGRNSVYSLCNGQISPGAGAAEKPPAAGNDHVRPLFAAGGASQPRCGDPGGEHHRSHSADLLKDGHHVALGACGGADHAAAAGAVLCL